MNVRPKKNLGQHFLTDHNIAKKIVSSLSDGKNNILEIGPGTGILTKYLLQKPHVNLYLIEIDKESVDYLVSYFPQQSDKIIHSDFLTFNLKYLFSDHFTLIGNFPYNISSQILFKVLDYREWVDEVVGMFQKEVAERITSKPGSKKYGILSVLLQAYYDIELLFTVSEHVFSPPPRVKSAVIRLKRNKTGHLDCNEVLFFKLVKAGFNQRRKTLRNALKDFSLDKSQFPDGLLSKRAEQLDVGDFIRIAKTIG
ncbi:MAG: 16S rRNA (adenine(1518)-N(6)/adenine(1519)-N(6))-dimethyltransferase RsmA [Bacteroidales bacterium]|nr:16S rRNA (adenine(1518)-N(6)/adenine(1519)-N(6))-dimethyltransferase RsmA [Bacteroidales bacterium]